MRNSVLSRVGVGMDVVVRGSYMFTAGPQLQDQQKLHLQNRPVVQKWQLRGHGSVRPLSQSVVFSGFIIN